MAGGVDGNPIHGLIRAFLGHRVAPNLVAIIMCVAGLVALTRMNTQFFPTTEIPTITIQIVWPGASAQEIADGILEIVEPEVRFIDGVDKITSYAIEGSVRITLEFKEGADMQKALSDVEQRMSTITTLPQDSERPVITRIQLYETVGMVLLSGPFEEGALQDAAKKLRDNLLEGGIDRVVFSGKRDREIWVEIPDAALRQLNISAREVANRIAVISQNTPLGSLGGRAEKQLRARGRMTTADGVAGIELRAFENGQKILVRDIAVVREAYEENSVQTVRNGQKAIVLSVQRAITGDTLKSMRAMLSTVENFRAQQPPSMQVEIYDVRAKIVDQRIRMLTENALIGFGLVILILLVFLNVRVAFWVAVGVPISLLATFAFMAMSGQTINAVSLVALILVLGIIVDDAIVVGEETATRFERGISPHDAAEQAANRMVLPVLASTSTTQAAFFPMFLITGIIGQIIVAIPMVVVVALLASLIECFATLPSHLKHTLEATERSAKRRVGRISRAGAAFRSGFDRRFAWFRDGPVASLINLAYQWRYVTLALAIASMIVAMGLVAGGRVKFTFFPVPEPETVYADITFTPGLSDEKMIGALSKIESAAKKAEGELADGNNGKLIKMTFATLGKIQRNRGENLARVEVELTPGEVRKIRTNVFARAWKKAIPQITGLESVAVVGRRVGPPGSDVDVRFTGASINTLKLAAVDLRRTLENYVGLLGITDDLPYGEGEVILELTPRGQALGFTTELVSRTVREKYQGAIAVRFARGDEEVTIRVRGAESERNRGLSGLLELTLKAPTGQSVPLSAVVRVVEQQAFAVVQRREGQLAVSVTANVDSAVATAVQVLASLEREALPALRKKYGVKTSFEGRAETQRQTFADLRIGTLLALALIYLILAFVFQRWLQPLFVMAIIPFGFVGMVVGHYVMDFNMALFSMIGLLGLSGILVNDAIVLVDRMNERVDSGELLDAAATGAAKDRFRAILLTTLTTIGGMSPLLFEKSLQAQFLIPIALTLCFGLAFATFILLFLLPAMIGIGSDITRGLAQMARLLLDQAAHESGARDNGPGETAA